MMKLFNRSCQIFLLVACLSGKAQTVAFTDYLLKDVGYVSIPNNLELQSGNYKKFAEVFQKEIGKKFGYEISSNRVVFQQKGQNNFDKGSTYARVMLETTYGNVGDYMINKDLKNLTATDISTFSSVLKEQNAKSLKAVGIKIIQWYGVSVTNINGSFCIKWSYLRQLKDNPPVYVESYQFHNNDKLHSLTLSYRKNDELVWKPLYQKLLASFTLTVIKK